MPFADPEKRRAWFNEYQRKRYAEKYASDPTMRLVEAVRKAEWFQKPEVKARHAAKARARRAAGK